MKIIFNRQEVAQYGKPSDPNNTPEKLVQRKEDMLHLMGEFMGADTIEYVDEDKSESYKITKKSKTLTLDVSGNQYDGGWINASVSNKKRK